MGYFFLPNWYFYIPWRSLRFFHCHHSRETQERTYPLPVGQLNRTATAAERCPGEKGLAQVMKHSSCNQLHSCKQAAQTLSDFLGGELFELELPNTGRGGRLDFLCGLAPPGLDLCEEGWRTWFTVWTLQLPSLTNLGRNHFAEALVVHTYLERTSLV